MSYFSEVIKGKMIQQSWLGISSPLEIHYSALKTSTITNASRERKQSTKTAVCIFYLDPPGPPEIKGYTEGETIRMGQTVSLTCLSYGGNPPATITWFRNGEMVDMSYTTSGRESRNLYEFVAASEDNNAKYSCEARNEMSVETLNAEVTLAVQCKTG